MDIDDVKTHLGDWTSKLLPVAGYLMLVATSNGRIAKEPDIHEEGCDCRCCRAFLAVCDLQDQMKQVAEELKVTRGTDGEDEDS